MPPKTNSRRGPGEEAEDIPETPESPLPVVLERLVAQLAEMRLELQQQGERSAKLEDELRIVREERDAERRERERREAERDNERREKERQAQQLREQEQRETNHRNAEQRGFHRQNAERRNDIPRHFNRLEASHSNRRDFNDLHADGEHCEVEVRSVDSTVINCNNYHHRATPPTPSPRSMFLREHSDPMSVHPIVISERQEPIPMFSAKTPASLPLQRNNEVNTWLRQIELLARPNTDAGRITAARTRCSGDVELIINSELFDDITSWSDFRATIKRKFGGTASAAEFLSLLSKKRLRDHQSPQDLYQEIQGAVLAGARDYARSLGPTEDLIRRTFLQGLPSWLQEAVSVRDQDFVEDLVAAAQRCWTARQHARHARPTQRFVAYSSDNHQDRPYREEPSPFHVAASSRSDEPYCAYHRRAGHLTRDCKLKPQGSECWSCKGRGHVRRNCPFRNNEQSSRSPERNKAAECSKDPGSTSQRQWTRTTDGTDQH